MSEFYTKKQLNSTNVRVYALRRRISSCLLSLFWRFAPEWTSRLILKLFFAPVKYRTNAQERTCLEQGRAFCVQVHDTTIQAWKWGQGPGVLLIHGWNGRGAQFHQFIAQLVNAGFTAIAFDGPAHGASTGRITNYFEFTDVVRAFFSKRCDLNIQGVIAHSFGAAAAINSLDKDQYGAAIMAVCLAPILRLQELISNTFYRFGVPQEVYMNLIGRFERRYGYLLAQDNPYDLIGRLRGPVLIVHDAEDRAAPFSDSHRISLEHEHIGFYSTRGLGHLRILSDAAVICTCIDWMRDLKALPARILTA